MNKPLRTPLEQELGEPLDLDLGDWTYGDLDAADRAFEAREAELLRQALAMGEFLYRQAVRSQVPMQRHRVSSAAPVFPVTTRKA